MWHRMHSNIAACEPTAEVPNVAAMDYGFIHMDSHRNPLQHPLPWPIEHCCLLQFHLLDKRNKDCLKPTIVPLNSTPASSLDT